MTLRSFKNHDLFIVSQALDIAEDRTGDFFKFSLDQWKRHRYDVKTLSSLKDNEICENAFALLNRGSRVLSRYDSKTKKRDFFFICIQDHQVLKAMTRDSQLSLLSLLAYVFTHELVHIVRFSNFLKRFEISERERKKEEKIVHETAFEILKDISLPKLDYVLESYRGHRVCDMALS